MYKITVLCRIFAHYSILSDNKKEDAKKKGYPTTLSGISFIDYLILITS